MKTIRRTKWLHVKLWLKSTYYHVTGCWNGKDFLWFAYSGVKFAYMKMPEWQDKVLTTLYIAINFLTWCPEWWQPSARLLLKTSASGLIPQPHAVLSCLDHKVIVLAFVSAGELCHWPASPPSAGNRRGGSEDFVFRLCGLCQVNIRASHLLHGLKMKR